MKAGGRLSEAKAAKPVEENKLTLKEKMEAKKSQMKSKLIEEGKIPEKPPVP